MSYVAPSNFEVEYISIDLFSFDSFLLNEWIRRDSWNKTWRYFLEITEEKFNSRPMRRDHVLLLENVCHESLGYNLVCPTAKFGVYLLLCNLYSPEKSCIAI